MTPAELRDMAREGGPTVDALSAPLRALCADATGDWQTAHRIVQDETSAEAAWVHAYLHRKEPDPGNAAYWYRRAGRPVCAASLETEWEAIATALLP